MRNPEEIPIPRTEMTMSSSRVLVLGAGVAGLTTAIALARRGVPV
ncbi:MAG: hypothetical protein QOG57_3975, partial [Pseudonocardiales bacterium]|nr:hypothetical protein [Pseudonocardiales bacterium]